ncbi:hypothetical protein D6833_00525 [Candidatus Parcubacteria bacterium]|nr:MAG: hypothetical protein D6833_00525 [Candidatus Parcubacteria bacterium]
MGSLIVVIVTSKDQVYVVLLKERPQIVADIQITAAIARAIRWAMQENEFPELAGGRQIILQPLILGAAGCVIFFGIQCYEVRISVVKGIISFSAGRVIGRQVEVTQVKISTLH